jgi:hypothetical protein
MTLEEAKEKFPIGARVKWVCEQYPHIKIGETGTVIKYSEIDGDWFFHVEWDDNSTFDANDGWFPERLELINQKTDNQKIDFKWNGTCSRCGAPAYLGLFNIECSKGCK